MGILDQVVESDNPRVMEAYEAHRQEHARYLETMQSAPKQGQQPGQVTGVPGNQPNFENQQVPTIPALQARVMGGPGGPVT